MKALIALMSFALVACSQEPGTDVVRGALEQSVHELPDSRDAVEILSVRKTDAKTEGHYFYYYQAEVRFPNGFRAHCLTDICTRYDPLGVTNNLQPQPPGTTVTFRGVLEFERRESGWVPLRGHLPDVVSIVSRAAAASGPTSERSPPSPLAPRSGDPSPLVSVGLSGDGSCNYRWEGSAVPESELYQRASDFLLGVIQRLGGAANLSEENMPVGNFQFDENAPFRCVRAVIFDLQRSGFAKIRIDHPQPGSEPWAQPMVFQFPQAYTGVRPPVDPSGNRIGLSAAGLPTWNGTAVDFVTLRQYCDLSESMNPAPFQVLQIGDATPYRQVRPLLAVLWRSHASRIRIGLSTMAAS